MADLLTSSIKNRDPVVIARRTFLPATETTTIDQDAYVMKRYRASGLHAIVQGFNPERDDLNALSERLLWEALDTGAIYEILGGILVPEGTTWSRAIAAETAALLRSLTAQEDKQLVYDRMLDILYDFLVVAAVSKLTSLKSSSRGQASETPPQSRPVEPPRSDAPSDDTDTGASVSLGNPEE